MIDKYKYIIEIKHLNKSFNSTRIIEDINLNVKRGETIVVLGKSGTGKSVILQCIIGLLIPENGEVIVFGDDIFSMSEKGFNAFRKKTGFLFQSGALYDSMSVRENLEFPLKRHYKLSKNELEVRVKKSLEEVGLLEAINKMPSEVSGGMRKRIGLARTLILQPEIILYDEPTTGLDPATSREISRLIRNIQKERNITSIVVTHDMECVEITADRVVVLKDGKFIINDTYDEVRKSKDEFIKSFFE
ncbi:MAG: ATP-binding cassette domain-containing protein [Ignavibacteria bacterium]